MIANPEGRLSRRLRRILLLLPYAIKHPGVSVAELARRFDATEEDVLADLNLVFLCGLPGYGPGDLIDVTIEDDRVSVAMADYFAAPLRLTPGEALALYAGGATLAALPDMAQADALKRALHKLGNALGVDDQEGGVNVLLDAGASGHLATLQAALREEKRVRLEYLSATTGQLSQREVDPWGLVAALGRWYLIAWDHSVDDERMFRVDRIKDSSLSDVSANVPDDFDPEAYRGAFVGDDQQPTMSLEISPEVARWFADYYPIRRSEDLDDGWRRVELIASGERWAATLLLRLGEGCRNVKPGSMATAARELATQIEAVYRD